MAPKPAAAASSSKPRARPEFRLQSEVSGVLNSLLAMVLSGADDQVADGLFGLQKFLVRRIPALLAIPW